MSWFLEILRITALFQFVFMTERERENCDACERIRVVSPILNGETGLEGMKQIELT
jgi:hypothetical protein